MAEQTETGGRESDPPGTPTEDEGGRESDPPAPADPEPEGVQPRPGEGTAGDDVVG
jgi:hypothetical protein